MTLAAIPTHYRGVQFRSKSEAVMARALDLAGFTYEYEPTRIGWYTPDFRVRWSDFGPNWYLEYKPSEPTDEYVERIYQLDLDLPLWLGWWNPFSGPARWVGKKVHIDKIFNPYGDWICLGLLEQTRRIEAKFEEARNFRFDLKSAV